MTHPILEYNISNSPKIQPGLLHLLPRLCLSLHLHVVLPVLGDHLVDGRYLYLRFQTEKHNVFLRSLLRHLPRLVHLLDLRILVVVTVARERPLLAPVRALLVLAEFLHELVGDQPVTTLELGCGTGLKVVPGGLHKELAQLDFHVEAGEKVDDGLEVGLGLLEDMVLELAVSGSQPQLAATVPVHVKGVGRYIYEVLGVLLEEGAEGGSLIEEGVEIGALRSLELLEDKAVASLT